MNCIYAITRKSNITACVNNLFTFFKLSYYIYFLFNNDYILLVFIWVPLDDIDLRLSLMLVRNTNDVEEETM